MIFYRKEAVSQIIEKANNTGKKLEIEIGSGNGHFLAEYGKQRPESIILGIEYKKQRCEKIQKKIQASYLDNCSLIYDDAQKIVDSLPPESINAFHIYFPDPWPKSKHRKRRFLRAENLDKLAQSLKPGGQIFFASDFFDYSLQAKILILLHPELNLVQTEAPKEVYLSMFAARFTELEKQINLVTAQKKGL
ncbi:MAG: hypothetical protein JXR70_05565 [Spirochaetales bacterium]|nr:hypothetical protein [Spirochaetales bacterium]